MDDRIITAGIVILLSILISYIYIPLDIKVLSKNDLKLNNYFSSDYYDARKLFRLQMKKLIKINPLIKHTILYLPNQEDLDLTIDIGIIPNINIKNTKSMMIHISGTHGVEGFAGSAIQSYVLNSSSFFNFIKSNHSEKPMIIFIHALNPFGFAKLRRWNENNVDLNRNYLSSSEFAKIKTLDPNLHGYLDINSVINPKNLNKDIFWFQVPYLILRYGFHMLKHAIVTGNYHLPKSLFYGGNRLEPSHTILRSFLTKNFDLNHVEKLAIIDVHTGLGRPGFDSLATYHYVAKEYAINLFSGKNNETLSHIVTDKNVEYGAMSGYSEIKGMVATGLFHLFPNLKKKFPLVQEFGTVNPLFILKVLRDENYYYHYDPSNRLDVALACQKAFYLHYSIPWKKNIIDRGTTIFYQMLSFFEK